MPPFLATDAHQLLPYVFALLFPWLVPGLRMSPVGGLLSLSFVLYREYHRVNTIFYLGTCVYIQFL